MSINVDSNSKVISWKYELLWLGCTCLGLRKSMPAHRFSLLTLHYFALVSLNEDQIIAMQHAFLNLTTIKKKCLMLKRKPERQTLRLILHAIICWRMTNASANWITIRSGNGLLLVQHQTSPWTFIICAGVWPWRMAKIIYTHCNLWT